jgi:hypothetical protein
MIADNPKLSKALAALICTMFSLTLILGVYGQGTTVYANVSNNQPTVGSTLTVTVQISNVQNLFGLDITLTWDPTILTLSASDLSLGVESHSDGVLHGTQLNRDYNTIIPGDIYVNETKVEGSYRVYATSVGQDTASFSGTGNAVTLQFTVDKAGDADFVLTSDLSDKPPSGGYSNFIDHADNAASVMAVTSASNGPTSTASPNSTATFTPQHSNPTTSPVFQPSVLGVEALAVLLLLIIIAIVLLVVFRTKKPRQHEPPQIQQQAVACRFAGSQRCALNKYFN